MSTPIIWAETAEQGTSDPIDRAARKLGVVSLLTGQTGGLALDATLSGLAATAQNIQAGSPLDDVRYDFGAVTFGGKNKPIYIGWAAINTATSAALWTINKYQWALGPDLTNYVPVYVQTRQATSWDNRATPTPPWN